MDVEGAGEADPAGPSDRAVQRTGTADRQAAVDALGQHVRAGRIGTQEYEDRSERAKRAVTWGDIDALFADLPGPHPAPVTAPTAPPVSTIATPAPAPPATRGSCDGGTERGLVPPDVGRWLMALAAPTALVLFFVLGFSWWVWLLIPVVSMIVYGPRERHR